jgi:phosphoglycerate dehydrogenase-like enzyme
MSRFDLKDGEQPKLIHERPFHEAGTNLQVPLKHVVVVPDDFPPVFADSTALLRLRRRPELDVHVYTTRPSDESELLSRISSANTVIVVRSSTRFNHNVIEGSPGLRHIAIWGTATDNISMDAVRRAGIAVTHTPDTSTNSVAEHALAMTFSLSHRINELDLRIRAGEWPNVRITQLAGKTAGVIGAGAVGVRFAELAHGVGMDVMVCSLKAPSSAARPAHLPAWAKIVDLDELIENADVVSLHGRLSAATEHLIDAARFEQMRPNAVIINTARGRLISEADLVVALINETIAGAALDVFEEEPLPQNSQLRTLSNVILSPHAAAATDEALDAGFNLTVDNVIAFLEGRPVPRVDR